MTSAVFLHVTRLCYEGFDPPSQRATIRST